jgi:hypothetical protein
VKYFHDYPANLTVEQMRYDSSVYADMMETPIVKKQYFPTCGNSKVHRALLLFHQAGWWRTQ